MMKKYFFTGFITLLPLALTLIIAAWLFNLFTEPLAGIMESLIVAFEKSQNLSPEHHQTLVFFMSRIFALILLLALIFLLGIFGQKFLINSLLRLSENVLEKIPLVRTIFRLTKEITKAVFSADKKTFQETVLLSFPHKHSHVLGFVTGTPPAAIKAVKPELDTTIFMPTAPHPISGFLFLTKRSEIQSTDITIEEAFKFLISCGTLHPQEETKEEQNR